MSEMAVVASKLDEHADTMRGVIKRIGGIEKAVSEIAVQSNTLTHQQTQITGMGVKLDVLTGPDGLLARVVANQARCPINTVNENEKRLDHIELTCAACPIDDVQKQMKSVWKGVWTSIALIGAGIITLLIEIFKSGTPTVL